MSLTTIELADRLTTNTEVEEASVRRIYYLIFSGLLILLTFYGCGNGDSQGSVNAGSDPARTLTLQNNSGNDVKVYIVFASGLRSYTPDDFNNQGCAMYGGQDRCSMIVPKGGNKVLNLNKGGINLSGGLDHEPMGPCPATMFEINISPENNQATDTFDVSLVNGFNYSMQIISSAGPATTMVTNAKGNQKALGVFPLGCTQCVSQNSNPPKWKDCPGDPATCGTYSQCYAEGECKSGPDEFNADVRCTIDPPTGASYTVIIGDPSAGNSTQLRGSARKERSKLVARSQRNQIGTLMGGRAGALRYT
jgi:hypothetical protein